MSKQVQKACIVAATRTPVGKEKTKRVSFAFLYPDLILKTIAETCLECYCRLH